PATLVPSRTRASTGSQPASRATRTARSTRRSPPTSTSAFGRPNRVPAPAASTAAATDGMAAPYAATRRLPCARRQNGECSGQARYAWDFPRQVLPLRAAADNADRDALEHSLYDRRFLIARPILQALEQSPAVLLIDEIDRADDEFEAFLLEVLADNAVTVPE